MERNWKENSKGKRKGLLKPETQDYDALIKMERSIKKKRSKLGKNLMINLLKELEDSKREIKENLNQVMNQIKSYAESVKMPHHQRKINSYCDKH